MFAGNRRMSVTWCSKVADDVGSIPITPSISQLVIDLGAEPSPLTDLDPTTARNFTFGSNASNYQRKSFSIAYQLFTRHCLPFPIYELGQIHRKYPVDGFGLFCPDASSVIFQIA